MAKRPPTAPGAARGKAGQQSGETETEQSEHHEDQSAEEERASDMTDIADVAQNQMPGTPQDLTVDPQRRFEEERRRAFEEMVAEREKRERDKNRR